MEIKINKVILFVLLGMFLLFASPTVSFAAKSEVEPNNSSSTANIMKLGEWYNGDMDGYYDKDYYKIVLPSDGNLEVVLNNDGPVYAGTDVSVVNGSDKEYVGKSVRVEQMGDESIFVGLPKGEYFIKVDNKNFENYSYKVKVNFTTGDYFEKEFNDTLVDATPILLNKKYTGSVGKDREQDFYKINIDKPGKLRVCFNNDGAGNGSPNIYVLDGKNYEFLEIDGRADLVGDECENIGLDKGEYYIRVYADYNSGYYYTLTTEFTATEFYEKEKNDDFYSANQIKLNEIYDGDINHSRDNDYYKVTLESRGKLTIKLNNSNSNAKPRVYLLDGKNNEYLDYYSNGNSFTTSEELPAGEYYVNIFGAYSSDVYTYSLTVLEDAVSRISGYSRYDTAIEISKEGWTTSDKVILTRGDNFADALAGVPLAHKLNAPILMTPSWDLWDNTLKEIKRLGAKEVIILGGDVAVSNDVSNELKKEGLNVRRISGFSRYETAGLIANEVAPKGASKVVVANGLDFPDALSVASHAAKQGLPILLTHSSFLPDDTKKAITKLNAKETIVVGGNVAVSTKVESQFPKPIRLSGYSRYETNVAIARHFGVNSKDLYVATGKNYADALTGAVLAAKNDSTIVLVHHAVPEEVSKYISDMDINRLAIFGGNVAVSDYVISDLENILRK